MKVIPSPYIQEILLQFSATVYPLLVFHLLPVFSNNKYLPALWGIWVFVSIVQGSSMATLRRLCDEIASDDWVHPAAMSHAIRTAILITTGMAYYTISDRSSGFIALWFLLVVFLPDVYVTFDILKSTSRLREKIASSKTVPTK